jgi:hypothetical protein
MEHLMEWIADDLHVRRLRDTLQEMPDDFGDRQAPGQLTPSAHPNACLGT